jgi:methylated-DNA-[protein]-cysteine S-methyltransferase
LLNMPLIYFGSIRNRRLGQIWVARSARGLVAVEFGISRTDFERLLSRRTGLQICHAPHRVQGAARQIQEYLIGRRRLFSIKIDWSKLASPFQRAALKAVVAIPYGQTRSYSQIARQIGYPRAPRAVGRANATNPMPLVIPCHRVIGADGSLRGYGGAGGLRTKAWLLKLESSRAERS